MTFVTAVEQTPETAVAEERCRAFHDLDMSASIRSDQDAAGLAVVFARSGIAFDCSDNLIRDIDEPHHYSIYGGSAFSTAELKAIATDAGVVLPDRVDMTLRNALQKGKKLFQPSGSGAFRPTAAGCMHFAEKWKVKPGKKAKPAAAKARPDAEA